MRTIVFCGTKGGVGKSLLCYNTGMFAAREHKVVFADLDPQTSLTELWQRRAELFNPQILKNVSGLANAHRRLAESGYTHDYLFVDSPGSHIPIIRDAVANADAILIPVQASALDVFGQEAAFDIVRQEGKLDRSIILLNRIDNRSKDFIARIEKLLRDRLGLPIVKIAQRVAYSKAGALSKSGIEIDDDALEEISNVWVAIQGVLNR